jgi:UDP-N-acetyl-D-glucosamine dehydrogenase
MGIAYKKDVDDTRESPALEIMELLESRGAEVSFHDPFVAEIPLTRLHPLLVGRRSEALSASALADFDLVLICTDHDMVDYAMLFESSKLIVDTRNVFARNGFSASRIMNA